MLELESFVRSTRLGDAGREGHVHAVDGDRITVRFGDGFDVYTEDELELLQPPGTDFGGAPVPAEEFQAPGDASGGPGGEGGSAGGEGSGGAAGGEGGETGTPA